jgi:hypothetical protein
MAKIKGPLFGQEASGIFGVTLDFTKDGNVRFEHHRAPPLYAGVTTSRAIMQAINRVNKAIGNGRRQELTDAFADPQNWASTIATHTIGDDRSWWLNDAALWSLLTTEQQDTWRDRADEMRVADVSIEDVDHTAHEITRGEALFHVACGVFRCRLAGSPAQPGGSNATQWKDYLTEGWPPLPVNVLVLANEPLLLGAEFLTLG